MLENFKKVSQRVKEIEKKSQEVPFPTPVQLQSSTKGKRENSDLSSTQEDGLQPSLKHARHV